MNSCRVRLVGSLLLVIAFSSAGITQASGAPAPNARVLSDYKNDDGSVPDGKDDASDDTSALRKALAAGPGVVYVGPGFYRWGDVTVPPKVAVVGAGTATIVRSSGSKQIFAQKGVDEWSVRDLVLEGEATGDWHKREDAGKQGLFISGCSGFEVAGVTLRNFNGAGLQIEHCSPTHSYGGHLDHITASGSYVGVRFDVRAEYINAKALDCSNNVAGCIVHAGNAKITASNFTDNVDGIVIEDKDNGSHGSISNSFLNHNERYALLARNVKYGMAISDCCFFYGGILIENSVGVNITNGIIGCSAKTSGTGTNRIAGNYVIPEGMSFEFTDSTIVKDNFTASGSWEKNR